MTRGTKQMGLRSRRSWAMIGAWGYDAPGCVLSPLRLEPYKQAGARLGRSTGGKSQRFAAFAWQQVLPERMRGQTPVSEARKKYIDTVTTWHTTERTP
jgi:hypothetical protein